MKIRTFFAVLLCKLARGLRRLLRRGAEDTEIAACVEKVIYAKPREHCFTEAAQERERADCRKETALMSRIGG